MKKFVSAVVVAVALLSTSQAFAWVYSYGTCSAYTTCYRFGQPVGTISCIVYGVGSQAQCRWAVIPGQAVACEGFVRDYRGYWATASFSYNCAQFY